MSRPRGRHLPPWRALILDTAGVTAAHAVAPWALSLAAAGHGWHEGWQGIWNLAGLIPVAAGSPYSSGIFAVTSWGRRKAGVSKRRLIFLLRSTS